MTEEHFQKQVMQRFDRVDSRLTALEQAEAKRVEEHGKERLADAIEHQGDLLIHDMVKDHDRILHGNGEPGLVKQFASLSSRIDAQIASIMRSAKGIIALLGILVTVHLGVLAVAAVFYKHLVNGGD